MLEIIGVTIVAVLSLGGWIAAGWLAWHWGNEE